MAVDSTVDGDTEEDEQVAHVVNVQPKQHVTIGKGKKRDLGDQQSDHKSLLTNRCCFQLTNFFSSIISSNLL